MTAEHDSDVIRLHPDDVDSSVGGPMVTPDPVPADDMVLKLSLAATAGAVVGSFVAFRWLRRRVAFGLRTE